MKRKTFAALLAGTILLTGCSSQTQTADNETAASGEAPAFTGPFAGELTQAWIESDSDFVRGVLADQLVDDQEWAEVTSKMEECFSDLGIKFEGFAGNGSYSTGPFSATEQETEEIFTKCENSSGETWLHPLKRSMEHNPDNVAFEEVMTECLIRNGLMPKSYTKEEFLVDNPNLDFPFIGTPDEQKFWNCNSDPSYEAGSK